MEGSRQDIINRIREARDGAREHFDELVRPGVIDTEDRVLARYPWMNDVGEKEDNMLRDQTAVGSPPDEFPVGPDPIDMGQNIFARQFARKMKMGGARAPVPVPDGRPATPPPPPRSFPPSIPPGTAPVGWLCPQCMATNAPWMPSCSRCNPASPPVVTCEGDR